ncbi:hypothetical protein [Pseudoalteromonas luteoviolacea]|uniref:Inverse autotransporter beta-domain domain-containing protein n=1 Tax=Pseudoalteromonas luteoviolacea NCIMB 1942 TaxID=1365253 RepID=A0A167H879_9GAMM|nr:hypothetical protein [Pseudoalteromonas luteoviolacea]KZN57743.1 hypothetical protein N482_04390 [Pseudoalteromonas luteoviolacea NCIMB 1942]
MNIKVINCGILLCILSVSFTSVSAPIFSQKSAKIETRTWQEKLNYFGSVSTQRQSLSLGRQPVNSAIESDSFDGDATAIEANLSIGGKLFPSGSIYTELTLDQTELEGEISRVGEARFSDFVGYRRYKSMLEVFYEHAFEHGVSVGVDIYGGSERYRQKDSSITDKEMGGAFIASKLIKLGVAELDIDYVASYRRLIPGNRESAARGQVYHSILTEYAYPLTGQLSGFIGARVSWFPNHNPLGYWGSQGRYALSSELAYRFQGSSLLALQLEKLWLSNNRSILTIAMKFEYRFSSYKTKRRKRNYKVPNLLIR